MFNDNLCLVWINTIDIFCKPISARALFTSTNNADKISDMIKYSIDSNKVHYEIEYNNTNNFAFDNI